jgi:hypothetical protein
MEGPDQKRPRLAEWTNSAHSPRHLPPPPVYPQHTSPFSRPEPPQPHNILDRRPSDHTPYDHHLQDPRRPNSGPAHAYYPHPPPPPPQSYGAPRDPMVKRDPSDEPPPSLFRPPSTGTGPDHNVISPSHHEASARPHAYDPTRPPSFQQSPYPPTPSPMPAPETYNAYPQNGLPAPRDQYPSVTYPAQRADSQQNQIKRKAQRAAQACDSCRTLKAKCDEGRPGCSSCKEKNVECRYRDPPPKQYADMSTR